MKNLHTIITLAFLIIFSSAKAAINGQWVMHPTFDNSVTRVIDTPSRTYFMGYNQSIDPAISSKTSTDQSLFYYDKEGDEIISAFRNHPLSSPAIDKIEYNGKKNYLLVLYKNQDIDLLYDSGEVVNIPVMLHADIPGARKINSVAFYPWLDQIWLATEFGYVIINDKRYEVEESRHYGVPIQCATRLGNLVVLTTPTSTYVAPAAGKRMDLTDYTRSEAFSGAMMLYPVSTTKMVANSVDASSASPNTARFVEALESDVKVNNVVNPWGNVTFGPTDAGLVMFYTSKSAEFDPDSRSIKFGDRPKEDEGIMTSSSWNLKDFFTVLPRKGLRSIRLEADGKSTLTRDFRLPNAPNAYWSRGMVYHPRYGMLVTSHGPEMIFSSSGVNSIREPHLLCGLNGGTWTPLSFAYRNPQQLWTGYDPYGLAVDPIDDKYVYSGSPFSGFTRINLDDPNDILHYTHPGDQNASLPGYVETNPTQEAWARLCNFSAPKFDNNNTLWSHFSLQGSSQLEFRYMTEADRKASKDAASARPWKKLHVDGINPGMYIVFSPLKTNVNKNLLLYLSQLAILVYDHNGTPENTSDDKKVILRSKFHDQDGGEVDLYGVNCMYEDPSTGNVWFGTESGVYYLQPSSILKGQTNLNRIKVSRNDGTSLADYLLNGVGVRAIIADPQGRKWFGSGGAGIVITSADGKSVIGEFTTSNSDIPSNNILNICYNPASNSMMVSTDQGLAELFIGGNPSGDNDSESVKAYPNPVAPDYYGWVTIDGLPDNSFVKIVDASGNLVRELGTAENGSIQWDVLNLQSRRVNTGVYYVLISPASGSGESNVAKILVMN